MKCQNCEKEFEPLQGDCPNCGAVPEVDARQISSQELHDFSGVTIDPEDDNGGASYQQQDRPKMYFKQISLSSGLLSMLLTIIVIVLFIFVAMPVLLFLALGMVAIWFFVRLFR